MTTVPVKHLSLLLASALLGTALLGAGCVTKPSSQGDVPAGGATPANSSVSRDSAYTGANLRPRAEQRFKAFVTALDRGDATAARALVSSQQRDAEFLGALTPEQLRAAADWYQTYEFGGVWGDRVEFRATRLLDGRSMSSVYVHFAPGEEGITY